MRTFPLVALLLVVVPALAQTTAQQGAVAPASEEPKVQLFKSPMVLTVPLGKASELLSEKPITFTDMANYRCDGVSITQLDVRARRRDDASAELMVDARTWTIEGHDKWVHILTELLVDGKVIATDEIPDLKSEEHSSGRGRTYIEIGNRSALTEGEPALRITLNATDECCPPKLKDNSKSPQQRVEEGIRP
jgi:hypothetical protein